MPSSDAASASNAVIDRGAPSSLLFTPITLRGVTARNRIVVSPMCQYASVEGAPTDWQLVHFGRYAMGGAGIVFGEETAVEARGRKTYHCAGIWNAHQVKAYRRVTDFIREMGAVPAIQIGHCGRNAGSHGAMQEWRPLDERDARSGQPPWRGLAPSPIPARRGFPVPIEMDHDDIRTVLQAFRDATHRAVDAGYDICEIHGAHGYLIHQFLSPVSIAPTVTAAGAQRACGSRWKWRRRSAPPGRRTNRYSSVSPRWTGRAGYGASTTRWNWRVSWDGATLTWWIVPRAVSAATHRCRWCRACPATRCRTPAASGARPA